MFCTACATLNPATAGQCLVCGARIGALEGRGRGSRRRPRGRALYALPLVLLLVVGGLGADRYRADRAASAAAYARAEEELAAGRYDAAIAAFARAGDYRDAAGRRAAVAAQLAPYRAAYFDGLAALEAGRYEDALAAFLAILHDLPDYEDVPALLERARAGWEDDLRRAAEVATSRRDWLAADRLLALLLAQDPDDADLAGRLAALRRDHAPLVFTRDGALYLVGPDLTDERLLTDEVPAVLPAWSPDRSRIAFFSTDPDDQMINTGLYVIDADGRNLRRLADRVFIDRWPVWSPDGERIAFTSMDGIDRAQLRGLASIRIADLATGLVTDVTSAHVPYAVMPTWSPDGERLAFITGRPPGGATSGGRRRENEVVVLTLATGELRNLTERRILNADWIAWSPRGEQILVYAIDGWNAWYEGGNTSIFLLDARSGAIEDVALNDQRVGRPYWSPDGRRFAFLEGDTIVRVRSLGIGDAWITVPHPMSSILSWSPDSSVVLAIAADAKNGSTLVPLADGGGPVADFPLVADLSPPWLGPPQWSGPGLAAAPGPPTIGGTGLDPAGDGA